MEKSFITKQLIQMKNDMKELENQVQLTKQN